MQVVAISLFARLATRPTQITISSMEQDLGNRFTPASKGRRTLTAALPTAPAAVILIGDLEVLRREQMPIAARERCATSNPARVPEQLKGIGEAHESPARLATGIRPASRALRKCMQRLWRCRSIGDEDPGDNLDALVAIDC